MDIPKRHKYWTIPGFRNYNIYKDGSVIVNKDFDRYKYGDIICYDKTFTIILFSDILKKYITINIVELLVNIFIGYIDLPIEIVSDNGKLIKYDYILNKDQIIYKNNCVYIRNKEFKRIPDTDCYYISRDGMIYSEKFKFGFLKKAFNHKGYLRVGHIYQNRKSIEVHILVYITYIGKIIDGLTIDHLDGNKQNNNVNNLELVTNSENIKRGYRTYIRTDIKWGPHIDYICDQMQKGVDVTTISKHFGINTNTEYRKFIILCCELRRGNIWTEISSKYDFSLYNNSRKLSVDDIKEIHKLLKSGISMYKISKLFNVSGSLIRSIRDRKIWKHVDEDNYYIIDIPHVSINN